MNELIKYEEHVAEAFKSWEVHSLFAYIYYGIGEQDVKKSFIITFPKYKKPNELVIAQWWNKEEVQRALAEYADAQLKYLNPNMLVMKLMQIVNDPKARDSDKIKAVETMGKLKKMFEMEMASVTFVDNINIIIPEFENGKPSAYIEQDEFIIEMIKDEE